MVNRGRQGGVVRGWVGRGLEAALAALEGVVGALALMQLAFLRCDASWRRLDWFFSIPLRRRRERTTGE